MSEVQRLDPQELSYDEAMRLLGQDRLGEVLGMFGESLEQHEAGNPPSRALVAHRTGFNGQDMIFFSRMDKDGKPDPLHAVVGVPIEKKP